MPRSSGTPPSRPECQERARPSRWHLYAACALAHTPLEHVEGLEVSESGNERSAGSAGTSGVLEWVARSSKCSLAAGKGNPESSFRRASEQASRFYRGSRSTLQWIESLRRFPVSISKLALRCREYLGWGFSSSICEEAGRACASLRAHTQTPCDTQVEVPGEAERTPADAWLTHARCGCAVHRRRKRAGGEGAGGVARGAEATAARGE